MLGYAAIGDLLFFLPVLEALRRAYPKARIVFLANRYAATEELLAATGLADETWYFDWEGPEGASRQAAINRRIHEAGFDLALLTLASPAHYFQWGLRDVPLRCGHRREFAPELSGWTWAWRRLKRGLITGEFARRALLNRAAWISGLVSEHALTRNLRLLEALGIASPAPAPKPSLPLSDGHRKRARELLGPDSGPPRVGVHLGAPNNQYHKMWAPERFAQLCRGLAQASPARFVLVGSADEAPSARAFLAVFPEILSLVGRLALLETFAVIERCDLFLSNDTGLAKAAMALGRPTASLLGPSDPEEVGIVWDREKHLEIRTGISCSPCARLGMAREGAGVINYATCGHHDCLRRLEVEFASHAIRARYAAILDRQ